MTKAMSKASEQSKVPGNEPDKHDERDELLRETVAAVSEVVASLSGSLEMLVQKAESMAFHIIATEEILAELVAAHGLDLACVNTRIRAKIAAGSDYQCSSDRAIDVAAAIASPLPRR